MSVTDEEVTEAFVKRVEANVNKSPSRKQSELTVWRIASR